VLLIAHVVIWQARCVIYGGFMRDWLIRGEATNDIDVQLTRPMQEAATIIKNALSAVLEFKGEKPKGAATALIFGKRDWKNIEVDLVENCVVLPPGVDCDVGNLAIDHRGILARKVYAAGSSELPLAKCVSHARKKKFVFFYNTADGSEVTRRRLEKYLARGWVCLSPVHIPEFVARYGALIKPKPKFSRSWF